MQSSAPTPAQILLQPSRPASTGFTSHTISPSLNPRLSTSPPLVSTSAFRSPNHTTNSAAATTNLTESPPLPIPKPFVLFPLFSANPPDGETVRGKVRIRVNDAVFYVHDQILFFSGSDFFKDLLSGDWAENEKGKKRRSVMTIEARDTAGEEEGSTMDEGTVDSASEVESCDSMDDERVTCRLHLVEEEAAPFQDLLFHLYPHLNCSLNWENVAPLMRMSDKFQIVSLRDACISFLLPAAAGRPILAVRIAEDHCIPELYQEASRYLLDNYTSWSPAELSILSAPTLLKLERKRNWFLSRLLKLGGSLDVPRDYSCPCASSLCVSLVEEKWKSAWSAASRFGEPQASIVYRSLRGLEPSLSSPALLLAKTQCQAAARLFFADRFDRMFGLGIVAANAWVNALSNTNSLKIFSSHDSRKSAARYFLFIELEGTGREKERRR